MEDILDVARPWWDWKTSMKISKLSQSSIHCRSPSSGQARLGGSQAHQDSIDMFEHLKRNQRKFTKADKLKQGEVWLFDNVGNMLKD